MEIGDLQRLLYDSICHRPMNFSFVDDYVCGSARIVSRRDVQWLERRGVKAILSLTQDPIPGSWLEGYGIDYLHVPVKNHDAPTREQLEACVDFVEKNVKMANKTLVHCAAGKGRTGTVIAAYFCASDNISAESAIEQIRAKRPGSIEHGPKSGQENAVIEFCKLSEKKLEKKGT